MEGLESMRNYAWLPLKRSADEGLVLTEAQVQALEKKKQDDMAACGERLKPLIRVILAQPGYFLCGDNQGSWAVFISKHLLVTLYSKKWLLPSHRLKRPITAADLLNDKKVLPLLWNMKWAPIRDAYRQGTEYCGKVETHDYELYLGVNDIEHTKTKLAIRKPTVFCEKIP